MSKLIGLLRSMAVMLLRALVGLYRRFNPKPLADVEKAFIKENVAFWSQYTKGSQDEPVNGYVLVENTYHPIIMLCNVSFAAIVSVARNLKPLFILNSPRDTSIKQVLESYYPNCAFVYVDIWRYLIPRLLTHFQAIKAFRTLKRPEDILKLSFDGIRYGDLIYDGVLSGGYATISRLDGKVLKAIRAFFWHRYVVKDIIRRYDIKASVFSHVVGLKSGTITRHLLQKGIEVFNRSGSYQIQLKKYQSMDDVGTYCLKPEPRYASFLMNRSDDNILWLADKYLDDRFNQNIKDIAVDLAFDSQKRTFNSKEEFCSHFGLDSDRKTIFVMLHAFNDQPHSHFAKPMIFHDYYDWFEKTLEIAKSANHVNWVFKEHPAADYYPTKDVSLDAIFEGVPHSHIRFLNRRADINSRSLRHVADAIITCMGTAGLEFSCLGIPCVLAGESTYSGFGFTVEPQNAVEYEEQLRHIDELPRLSEKQIRAAKIVMAFQYVMMQGAPYLFCPYYEDYNKIRKITNQELWQDAAELMKNGNKEEMKHQVSVLSDFIRDPSYTQYLNLEKYAFMKEAVYGNEPEQKVGE